MKSILFIAPLLVCSTLYSTKAFTQFNTARTLGFAGAGSVNAESTGLAMTQNPGALSLNADLEFGAGYGRGELATNIDQEGYYLWSKDSMSSSFGTKRNQRVKNSIGKQDSFPFAAAVMFMDYKTDQADYKAYQLSVSRVLKRRFSLGASAKYFDGEISNQVLSKWSGDLGLVYKRSKRLNLGLSWINMGKHEDIEERLRLGALMRLSMLASLFIDADYSLESIAKKWSFGAGFEAKIRELFSFRAGYFVGAGNKADFLGVGASFKGPRLKIHYGVKIEMDSKAALHSVDFSLPLW